MTKSIYMHLETSKHQVASIGYYRNELCSGVFSYIKISSKSELKMKKITGKDDIPVWPTLHVRSFLDNFAPPSIH